VADLASGVSPPAVTEPVEDHLRFPGGKVHLLRGGSGPPLLFLHAAGGAGVWHPYLQQLAGRFEVFAPDHPGFGGSDDLTEVEAIDDLVYHYLDLMDRLDLRRPHVVGGSFGGWIGAELAVAAPYAVGSLVLLGAVGLRLPEHPVADLFLMTPDEVVAVLFRDTSKAAAVFPTDPDVDAILATYRDLGGLARFCWVPFMNNPKLERRLHRITVPTRVIWAGDDQLVPIEHGQRYAELIPGAELVVVPDCGHAMYF
jgi:pimeloyl-ACP methyl ester carboxylesterase